MVDRAPLVQPVQPVTRYATVGTTAAMVSPKLDSTASALVWFFILLIILIVIVAIIVWIVRVSFPGTKNDVTMRDLCARDVRASNNSIIGRNLTVGCRTTLSSATVSAFAIEPIYNESLNIEMSGRISSIVMTNASSTPVTVTLPVGADTLPGFIVLLTNAGGAGTFVVQPSGTDTLNGGTSAVTISAPTAMFYSTGVLPVVSTVNWTQIA